MNLNIDVNIVSVAAGRGDFYDATNGYTNKEYYYDKNGNMWLDRNKRMKTVYNYLNLPSRVSDTITPANKIEYVYTSAGEKLKQRLSTGTTLLHFGNYVYTLDGTANGIAVKYILTQEGRATNSAGTYTYEYFMKDHLGNTRASFNVPSSTAVIVQQSDYYPFGMIHLPQATTTSDNRYLYNGKELQNNLLGGVNLDIYDFQARFYDPQIARWSVIDPAAELGRRWSPYAYTFNNPIRFLDPDGMWPDGGPSDDPLLAARLVKTVMQDITIGVYNTVTWLGSMVQPTYNPMRSIATKVQGDDGYYYVDKTIAFEAPLQRLAGVLDPIGVAATFTVSGPVGFMAKSIPGTSVTQTIKATDEFIDATGSLKGASRGSLEGTKEALIKAKSKIGLEATETLPKGKQGKFGSPQRGNAEKGYRLDPSHPNAKIGSGEEYPHINFWDYTKGKRGSGGIKGVEPIKY